MGLCRSATTINYHGPRPETDPCDADIDSMLMLTLMHHHREPDSGGRGPHRLFPRPFFSFFFFSLFSLVAVQCGWVGGLGVGLAGWVRIQDTKLLLVAAGLRECVRARCCWSRCPPSLMSEYQWPLPRCHEESLSGRLPRRGNSAACGPTSLVLGEAPLSPNPMRCRWARFSPRRVNVIIMSVSESVKGKKKTRS